MLESLKKIFSDLFVTESDKTKDKNKKYKYGCVMLGFEIPEETWKKAQDIISDNDITTKEGLGREMDPHVTILYGIHSDVPDEDVEALIDELISPEIRFNHLSIFENPEFDVVKYTIRNKALEKMNKMFKELPYTNDFPKYEPHVTLAYVEKGKGSKYSQTLKGDLDFKLKPTEIIYSKADGTKKKYKFKDGEKN